MSTSASFDGTNYLVAFQEKIDQTRHVSAQFVSQSGSLVGSKITLDLEGGTPRVALDGTNYFLITEEDSSPATYIYGQFVSKTGEKSEDPIYITTGGTSIVSPAMVFDGTNYFVVWNDSQTLYGQFVSPEGQLVGGPITLCSETAPSADAPEVYNVVSGGTNILIAWADSRRGAVCGGSLCELDIYGQFVEKSGAGTPGSLAGVNFPINENADWSDMFSVGLAFDGTNYLVSWNDMTPWNVSPQPQNPRSARLYAQLISTSGTAVGEVISIGTPTQNQYRPGPMLAFDGANYLLTWINEKNDRDRDHYCDPTEGTCWDSYGQFISPLGQLQGPTFLVSGGGKSQFSYPVFGGGRFLLVTNSFDQFDGTSGTISGTFISPQQANQTGVPRISASPASLNFGKVRFGDAPEGSITIRNTGTLDLTTSAIVITGLHLSEFSQTNDCTTIPAGGSCTLTATFTPALPFGSKSAAVSISSNDPSKPSVSVKLLGNASPPKISVSPVSVNFGSVGVDSTSLSKTVRVSNTGVSDLEILEITDISITGLNADEFSQTHDCTTIPAGGFCTVTGTFAPTSVGSKTAALSLSSNDPKKPTATVKLLGKASPREFQITVIQPDGGGKITLKGQTAAITKALVKENTNVYFTLKPERGFHLSAVMMDGNLIFDGTTVTDPNLTQISTSETYQYAFMLVTGPHTLAAQFAEEGQETFTVRGSLGAGYVKAMGGVVSPRFGAPDAPLGDVDKKVDKILALQSDRGYLGAESMQYSRSTTINDDGTFSIGLDTTRDWLLVLMDSTAAARTDQFVGYVALNTGTAENLLQLPLTTSTISDLDLGTVTASGDVGQSENSVNADDFSLNSAQLLSLAKNDDAFKSVKNFVINYDNATGVYYTLRPDFRWKGSYDSINGVFQRPDDYTYSHYGFQLDSNTTTITIDKICGTNGQAQVIVDLVPPSDVTSINAKTFNPGNPMSSANVICSTATDGFIEAYQDPNSGSGFFATNRYGGVSQSYAAGLTGTIPQGYWLYHEGDQLRGQFDVSVASPLGVDNRIKGFVPSIKVNSDGDGRVTRVDIKWHTWDDSTSQYVELTDVTVLKYLIGTGDLYFDNNTNGTRTYESVHFDPAVDTSVTPSQYTWYYGEAGPANRQVMGFGIFYSSGGIGFYFDFFRN